MEVFTRLIHEFSIIPHVSGWNEVQALFRRAAVGKPKHWLLPLHTCESVGGTEEQALPAILAVACSHIGIVLVDDMLDADPRGVHLKLGEGAAANMASALQSAALAAVSHGELESEAKLAALECVNEMFLATAIGQYWDVTSIVADEDSYWKIAKGKSSPFFGAAFKLGALMGGASAGLAAQLWELGVLYGEMIQIHDDVKDTLEIPANPDWDGKHAPLPILFARLVEHPLQARFEELLPNARNSPTSLEEAQEILIRCGAVSYCIHQLLMRYESALKMLQGMALPRPEGLEKAIEEIARPAFQLLEAGTTENPAYPVDRE